MLYRILYSVLLFILLFPQDLLSFEKEILMIEEAFEENFKQITLNPSEINIYRVYPAQTKLNNVIGGLPGDWKKISKDNIKNFNPLSPSIDDLKKFATGPHEGYFRYSYELPIENYKGIDNFSDYNFYFVSNEIVSKLQVRIIGTVTYEGNQYRVSSGWLSFDRPAECDGFLLITKNKLTFEIQPIPGELLNFFYKNYMSTCDKRMEGGKIIETDTSIKFVLISYKIFFDPDFHGDCRLKKNATHFDLFRVDDAYKLLQHFTVHFGA